MREQFIYYSYILDPFFLFYFAYINFVYAILTFLGLFKVYKRFQEVRFENLLHIYRSESLPEITFMVAAYNEAGQILATVDNLLAVTYEKKRILVINDGSEDETFELLKDKYQLRLIPHYYQDFFPSKPVRGVYQSLLYPKLMVIDKENGEKFDALNAGLNACQTEYFITCDADTFIDDSNFEALIRPLFAETDTIALGAAVYIRNGCLLNYNRISVETFQWEYLASMQAIEYIRAFLGRQGWDYLGGNFVMSGAFSMLSKAAVIECGGFAPTVANDMEIILRLNRVLRIKKKHFKISYLPDPVAWTDAPENLKELGRQRAGWHRGLLESIWFHKKAFFNPRLGAFGFFVYPFLVLGEALEPVIEALGYIYIILGLWLQVIDYVHLLLLIAIIWVFTFMLTLVSLIAEEASFGKYSSLKRVASLIFFSFIENLGYRQLNLIWRLRGFKAFFKKFSTVQRDSKYVNTLVNKAVKKGINHGRQK